MLRRILIWIWPRLTRYSFPFFKLQAKANAFTRSTFTCSVNSLASCIIVSVRLLQTESSYFHRFSVTFQWCPISYFLSADLKDSAWRLRHGGDERDGVHLLHHRGGRHRGLSATLSAFAPQRGGGVARGPAAVGPLPGEGAGCSSQEGGGGGSKFLEFQ